MRIMKKLTLIASCVALLLSSCAHEYNQVLKSGDYTYKYEGLEFQIADEE